VPTSFGPAAAQLAAQVPAAALPVEPAPTAQVPTSFGPAAAPLAAQVPAAALPAEPAPTAQLPPSFGPTAAPLAAQVPAVAQSVEPATLAPVPSGPGPAAAPLAAQVPAAAQSVEPPSMARVSPSFGPTAVPLAAQASVETASAASVAAATGSVATAQQGMQTGGDDRGPFISVPSPSKDVQPPLSTTGASANDTRSITLDVASPNVIVSVYLLMYVPIGMGWMAVWQYGSQEAHYVALLPITLCALIVGLDLINQSLSIVMNSPMAITAIQGVALAVITGVWSILSEWRKPSVRGAMLWPLLSWGVVALMFTLFQLINHQVSYWCSLSERTVFTNLCPLVSMFVEITFMPKHIKVTVSFWSKMALATMVLGAILYSIQYPDFTPSGVFFASLMVAVIIPYRLMQRYLLAKCATMPLQLLAFCDGVFLIVPSSVISATQQNNFWTAWSSWFSHPSICLMLMLSLIIFMGNHICGLMMLRMGSATNYLVFHNLANFLVVTMGILFFGDDISSSPLELTGLIISLLGGLWYAVEMQRRHHSDKAKKLDLSNEDDEEKEDNARSEPWEGRSEDGLSEVEGKVKEIR